MNINIGIPDNDRATIAKGLSKLLADSYTLYLKTHNYHWNVTGPMFNTLHLMFEAQYTELALAVDRSPSAFARWDIQRQARTRRTPVSRASRKKRAFRTRRK